MTYDRDMVGGLIYVSNILAMQFYTGISRNTQILKILYAILDCVPQGIP